MFASLAPPSFPSDAFRLLPFSPASLALLPFTPFATGLSLNRSCCAVVKVQGTPSGPNPENDTVLPLEAFFALSSTVLP